MTKGALGLWGSGKRGGAGLREAGAGRGRPVIEREGGKDGFLFDGGVRTADGANKRPLGVS